MSSKLNRSAYEKLVDEDIHWLLSQPRTLERDHVHAILRASAGHEYDDKTEEIERLKRRVENEHECAEELKEGLSKQYRESATELDALDKKLKATIQALKMFMEEAAKEGWWLNKSKISVMDGGKAALDKACK